MDVKDAVKNRFSLRKYKSDPIPDDVLNRVLEAGRLAPSWANVQATRYILVSDPKIKAALADCLTPRNPAANAIAKAPVVIALCFVKEESGFYKGKALTSLEGKWGFFDAGLAAANITLAAVEEGLGTVHAGALDIEKASKLLDVPVSVQLMELIPLGYPDQSFNSPKRKELSELVFYNGYGKEK